MNKIMEKTNPIINIIKSRLGFIDLIAHTSLFILSEPIHGIILVTHVWFSRLN
jgi:uncharacterized membrane protein YagU involved in acid resistance